MAIQRVWEWAKAILFVHFLLLATHIPFPTESPRSTALASPRRKYRTRASFTRCSSVRDTFRRPPADSITSLCANHHFTLRGGASASSKATQTPVPKVKPRPSSRVKGVRSTTNKTSKGKSGPKVSSSTPVKPASPSEKTAGLKAGKNRTSAREARPKPNKVATNSSKPQGASRVKSVTQSGAGKKGAKAKVPGESVARQQAIGTATRVRAKPNPRSSAVKNNRSRKTEGLSPRERSQSASRGLNTSILKDGKAIGKAKDHLQRYFRRLRVPVRRKNYTRGQLRAMWASYADEVHTAEFKFLATIKELQSLQKINKTSKSPHPLLPPINETELSKKERGWTQNGPRKTLVLDLDETLVHSAFDVLNIRKPDLKFGVKIKKHLHVIYVKVRPSVTEFLKRMAELYEVVVFTSAQKLYADRVLNHLDPTRTLISHRIYRESCELVEGNYIKDLTHIGRPLNQTVLVDNSLRAFAFQLSNGIPVEGFYGNSSDSKLLNVIPFLTFLSHPNITDVRPWIEQEYNIEKLLERLDDVIEDPSRPINFQYNRTFTYTESEQDS